jgi:hypothetical protein
VLSSGFTAVDGHTLDDRISTIGYRGAFGPDCGYARMACRLNDLYCHDVALPREEGHDGLRHFSAPLRRAQPDAPSTVMDSEGRGRPGARGIRGSAIMNWPGGRVARGGDALGIVWGAARGI